MNSSRNNRSPSNQPPGNQPSSNEPRGDQWLAEVNFNDAGLVAAIAQDHVSGRLLMMAWMNEEALRETVSTGLATYWSRSRKTLWRKGERSGHVQHVKSIQLDCDGDVLVLGVEQVGGIACHTGRESCFFRTLTAGGWQETEAVLKAPEEIYK